MSSKSKLNQILAQSRAGLFGEKIRNEFSLEFENYIFCNQGSYGTAPKCVVDYKNAVLGEIEANPDIFVRRDSRASWDRAVAKVARFLGADPANLTLIENTTDGVNAILKSLRFETEDQILCNDHTYAAIANTIEDVASKWDADVLSIDLTLPIKSEAAFVDFYVNTCKLNRSIKIAVIDHISSQSAIVTPVKRIAEELRKEGVLTLIDGAHAPAQICGLKIEELGCDFYVGNLHKWAYAPRGCAILWVAPQHQPFINPLRTSFGYGSESFQQRFFALGTRDFGNYLAAEASITFIESFGGPEAIAAYVRPMLDEAAEMIKTEFGTETIPIPKSMEAPYMRMIALPENVLEKTRIAADKLVVEFTEQEKVVVAFTSFGSRMWIRISGSVWNTKEDYQILLQRLKSFLSKYSA